MATEVKVLLTQILAHTNYLDGVSAALHIPIEGLVRLFREDWGTTGRDPGVDKRAAQVLIAEIGGEREHFPIAGHLAFWAGEKRAAVGHAILIAVYRMIKIKTVCGIQDLGADYFDRLDRHAVARRLKKRLEAIGFQVELQDLESAAA